MLALFFLWPDKKPGLEQSLARRFFDILSYEVRSGKRKQKMNKSEQEISEEIKQIQKLATEDQNIDRQALIADVFARQQRPSKRTGLIWSVFFCRPWVCITYSSFGLWIRTNLGP